MQAFHGDPAIKAKYVNRLMQHRVAERLIQGTGWDLKRGKGCAVGCTLENYDHDRYPLELGLPVWLARYEDLLFESLPKEQAEQFAIDLLNVIPVGADVRQVARKLSILRLEQLQSALLLAPEKDLKDTEDALAVIQYVIKWHKTRGPVENEKSLDLKTKKVEDMTSDGFLGSTKTPQLWARRCALYSVSSEFSYAAIGPAYMVHSLTFSDKNIDYYEWEAATLLRLLSECKPG